MIFEAGGRGIGCREAHSQKQRQGGAWLGALGAAGAVPVLHGQCPHAASGGKRVPCRPRPEVLECASLLSADGDGTGWCGLAGGEVAKVLAHALMPRHNPDGRPVFHPVLRTLKFDGFNPGERPTLR